MTTQSRACASAANSTGHAHAGRPAREAPGSTSPLLFAHSNAALIESNHSKSISNIRQYYFYGSILSLASDISPPNSCPFLFPLISSQVLATLVKTT